MIEKEWEPGDPLYRRSSTPYQGYFYNFRPVELTEVCSCADRASWPEPAFFSHELKSEEWFMGKFREQAGLDG